MPQLVTISLSTGGMTPVHYEAGERMAHVSPDGRWIAYTGTEGGVLQVYVRPANASGPVLQVSTAGGEHPRWGRDGGRLFYRDGQRMNEVVLGSEPTPRVVRRAMLFADRYERVGITSYDVTTSGDFVMLQGDSTGQHIDVLVNATVLARRSAVLQPVKRE
ncbi:MAG: PD40 domain-containing protein [Gemmatimonadetes bacterium]|nr:PD40 domain-containing protein [Gemmatimonadota bacterium]